MTAPDDLTAASAAVTAANANRDQLHADLIDTVDAFAIQAAAIIGIRLAIAKLLAEITPATKERFERQLIDLHRELEKVKAWNPCGQPLPRSGA